MVPKPRHAGEVLVVLGVLLVTSSVVRATSGPTQVPQARILQPDELTKITASYDLKECFSSATAGCNVCHPVGLTGKWQKCHGTAYWYSHCEGESAWQCVDVTYRCTICGRYDSETDCENDDNGYTGSDEDISNCYYL